MEIRRLAFIMHHFSALSTTHLLSYHSNYQRPTTDPWSLWSILFVTITVSSYNPPSLAFQRLPNTHRRDNIKYVSSTRDSSDCVYLRPNVACQRLSPTHDFSRPSDCLQGVADGPSRPFDIASQHPLPSAPQHPIQ